VERCGLRADIGNNSPRQILCSSCSDIDSAPEDQDLRLKWCLKGTKLKFVIWVEQSTERRRLGTVNKERRTVNKERRTVNKERRTANKERRTANKVAPIVSMAKGRKGFWFIRSRRLAAVIISEGRYPGGEPAGNGDGSSGFGVRGSPLGVRSASGSAPNPLYSRFVFVPSVPLW
jgi:hypothetical protein